MYFCGKSEFNPDFEDVPKDRVAESVPAVGKRVLFIYYMIRRFYLLLLLSLLGGSLSAQDREEIRAVWLTTNYQLDWPSEAGTTTAVITRQKQEMVRLLDRLKECGINTVFFQTRIRGAVFYHSDIEPQSRFLTGKTGEESEFDPLAFVLQECHLRQMECHAWMVCMPLGGKKYIRQHGLEKFVERNSSFITVHHGEYFLEPAEPRTADYLASIAAEIVKKYEVDGIHLDYIRYPEKAASYPDAKRYAQAGKKGTLAQWRRDNITHIVYTIHDRIKAVRPEVALSSAPLGLYDGRFGKRYYGWNAFDAGFQEVERWLKEDKHDFIAPMMYYKGAMFFPFVADWCLRSHGKPVIPGLGIYRLNEPGAGWDLKEIEKQIWWSRRMGAGGYALFRVRNLLDDYPALFWRIQYLND